MSIIVRASVGSLDTNRFLQSSSNNEDPDVFEFLGFVAWYLFLVVCCIIPTACAYRRRRMHQNRQQQNNQPTHMQDNAQIYFTNYRFSQRQEQEEVTQKQIQDALQKTTMDVQPQDLMKLQGESFRLAKRNASEPSLAVDENDSDREKEQAIKSTSTLSNEDDSQDEETYNETKHEEKMKDVPVGDEEMGGMPTSEDDIYFEESEREFSHVQLPDGRPNGNRLVPSACAICLCPYEVGDQVTWSPEEQCQHAFHRDCIVSWLGKKREHLCPCCRQEFCVIAPNNNESTIAPNDNGMSLPPPLERTSSFP